MTHIELVIGTSKIDMKYNIFSHIVIHYIYLIHIHVNILCLYDVYWMWSQNTTPRSYDHIVYYYFIHTHFNILCLYDVYQVWSWNITLISPIIIQYIYPNSCARASMQCVTYQSVDYIFLPTHTYIRCLMFGWIFIHNMELEIVIIPTRCSNKCIPGALPVTGIKETSRYTEIAELDGAACIDENVTRLDVPVDMSMVMKVL